jgi:GxxExxY protein
MAFTPISEREDQIGKLVVNAAFNVHRNLGPGLLENVYEVCFCHELLNSSLDKTKGGSALEQNRPLVETYRCDTTSYYQGEH